MPYPSKDNKNKVADEAKPDYPSCPTVTVDLSEDITEDIAHRENEYGSRENKKTETYYLYSNNIGGDETGNEDSGNNDQSV